jgi:hypothetical protein|tara:strand:+ start:441 stop:578 length:138 start_codon:yes stop_codon:yes gene_type:complete
VEVVELEDILVTEEVPLIQFQTPEVGVAVEQEMLLVLTGQEAEAV